MIDMKDATKSVKLCFHTKKGNPQSTMIEKHFINKLDKMFSGLSRAEWLSGTKGEAEKLDISHARYLRALCV